MKTKYRFKTRAAAEEAQQAAENNLHVYRFCLTRLLRGEVSWFKTGKHFRLGLIAPDSPSGGYCLLEYRQDGQPNDYTAWYVDDLWSTYCPERMAQSSDPLRGELTHTAVVARTERDKAAGYC